MRSNYILQLEKEIDEVREIDQIDVIDEIDEVVGIREIGGTPFST